jgi:hypothetical protein
LPAYADEIRGIAEGANTAAETVAMLNVRQEIGFALLARHATKLSNLPFEGCTAVGLLRLCGQGSVLRGSASAVRPEHLKLACRLTAPASRLLFAMALPPR